MRRVVLLGVICLMSVAAAAQSKEEKINVSYWYVFGRFPNADEMNYWKSQPEQRTDWYINNHQSFLQANDPFNTQAVTSSYKDAFGRQPSKGELDFWKKQKRPYADLMSQHVQYLLQDAAENKSTITRAYQAVFGRAPSNEEMKQWSSSNFSYLILTACLHSYKSAYRLQSVDAVLGFMKNAWETTANFVVNTGSAAYNAAASAISATVAAGQRILTLSTSNQMARDIQSINTGAVGTIEGGQTVITGGAGYMRGLGSIVGLNTATLISDRGCGIIAAGGLN